MSSQPSVPVGLAGRRPRLLSEVEIFQDLPAGDVDAIGRSAPMREVEAGRQLYAPGTGQQVLFILKRGRVRLYRVAQDGRTLTLSFVEPGEIFGEMEVLAERLDASYAEALEPSVVCLLSAADVDRLLLSDARISARITAALSRRVAELEQRLEDAVFRSVPSRIVSTLVVLAGGRSEDIRLTHEQLADLVGTTRETTTKVLGELRDRHVVELRRGRIRVLDPTRLRALGDDPGWSAPTGGHATRALHPGTYGRRR